MILVLIGIIAVLAVPRLPDVTTTNAGAFSNKLRADIRYIQSLAMIQNRSYRIYFNGIPAPSPSGYAAVYDTSGGAWTSFGYAQDPALSGNLSVTLNTSRYAGITVSTPAGGYIQFDSLGRPTVGGGTVLTVSPGGYTVTITGSTGSVN